jgi:large conductance mechanosensitive channel
MFNEFKKFILRGNVVDLAVGVAIGTAFTGVINALVRDFITPLVTVVYGGSKLSENAFSIRHIPFPYGDFINTLITFIIVAAVVFFLVVQPINKITEIAIGSKDTEQASTRKCPECLSEIPKKATRCKFCTAKIEPKEEKATT